MSWTGRCIDFPFRFDSSGKIAECGSYDALVRAQVIDAVMTNQGERVFRPRYGCDIQSALFDPSEELVRRDAASYIKKRLENFVSRSIVQAVSISDGEPGTVLVDVRYRSTPYATISSVQIPVSSEFLNRQGAIQ